MVLDFNNDILARISSFVKSHFNDKNVYDIIMFIIVALLIMLSFAAGFIAAKYQDKQPIQIEQNN